MLFSKLPLAFHILVETPAAGSFILKPRNQLPLLEGTAATRAEADLILCNLGGALIATNLVALVLILRPDPEVFDRTGRLLTLALASYHIWPTHRALSRLVARPPAAGQKPSSASSPFGGPAVHLAAHMLCFAGLVYSGLFGGG